MMAPVVETLAQKFINRCIVAKIDTSRNPKTAMSYNVRGVPSFQFFKNGKVVDQVVGAVPENILGQKLSGLL